MNYANHDIKILHSTELIGADPIQRGTWLMVWLWCCEQENGGRIEGGAEWKDRRWQQTCGVTAKEVRSCAPLITIDGTAVVVFAYPSDLEAKIKAKRRAGEIGGQSKSQAKTQAARGNGTSGGRPGTQAKTQAETKAQGEAETQAEPKHKPNVMECNVRKGKVKEEEGESRSIALPQANPPPPPPPKESISAWKARLQAKKPNVSIDAELAAAAKKRKATTGSDAVPRDWFERSWWPNVDDPDAVITGTKSPEAAHSLPAIPPPRQGNWKIMIAMAFPTPESGLPDWAQLKRTQQEAYSNYLSKLP